MEVDEENLLRMSILSESMFSETKSCVAKHMGRYFTMGCFVIMILYKIDENSFFLSNKYCQNT